MSKKDQNAYTLEDMPGELKEQLVAALKRDLSSSGMTYARHTEDIPPDEAKLLTSHSRKILDDNANLMPSLDDLVSEIDPENAHGEVDFGPPVDKEES
ncbi:AbrB/MazE/SpoVT family DNA-binding domain-containing protein [Paracoccus saliphilus]|uniref:Uncharacterized protein n=1 Tax=Paracoccus saliphilus TaxID=405559 RepID=A0AA45W6H6_9RHOB|nr:hypothetical protein [Paracoccus saliphilus]WCR04382.1 hypothetical protein JHX88_06535 [Paracoccus saliphilus]SIT02100.1 hypothetical protein SAMN05421772_112140 [Paracoccus saliphilus]